MKHLILILSMTLVALSATAQQPDTIPSLYEWFFPGEPMVQVESSGIGLKTKAELTDKFRRKADRMAIRWLRKAERSRKQAEWLRKEADELIQKAKALRDGAILKEKEALWLEAEKAKILDMKLE